MVILLDRFVEKECPDDRLKLIEEARNILNSLAEIRHLRWIIDKIFDKWGSGYIGDPALNEKDIRTYAQTQGYTRVAIQPSSFYGRGDNFSS